MGTFEFDEWQQGQLSWPDKRDGPRLINRRGVNVTTHGSLIRRSSWIEGD